MNVFTSSQCSHRRDKVGFCSSHHARVSLTLKAFVAMLSEFITPLLWIKQFESCQNRLTGKITSFINIESGALKHHV